MDAAGLLKPEELKERRRKIRRGRKIERIALLCAAAGIIVFLASFGAVAARVMDSYIGIWPVLGGSAIAILGLASLGFTKDVSLANMKVRICPKCGYQARAEEFGKEIVEVEE